MIKGYIDTVAKNYVSGWSMDTDNREAKLDVSVYYDGQVIVRSIANQSRSDLLKFGDEGRFGFNVTFEPVAEIDLIKIYASSGDTRKELPFSKKCNMLKRIDYKMPYKKFNEVACDITHNCNNRCRFCFNYWEKPHQMAFDLYKKIIDILPYYVENTILISCLYEPTLHKKFIEFLEYIPANIKHKFYLTTNLARKLKPDFFERLAICNLDHINISLETLDKTTYKNLMLNKNSNFFENIEKLADAFRANAHSPKIHIITMITRDNASELINLAKYAHDRLEVAKHQFRTPYYSNYIPSNWLLTHTLTKNELSCLLDKFALAQIPNTEIKITSSQEDYLRILSSKKHHAKALPPPPDLIPVWQPLPYENKYINYIPSPHNFPRINSRGYFTTRGLNHAFNLNSLQDLNQFFNFVIKATHPYSSK